MNRTSLKLTLMLAATLVATIGCSTKNYVRQQTTPLINKTNELDDLTAKNSRDIKDVRPARPSRNPGRADPCGGGRPEGSGCGQRSR